MHCTIRSPLLTPAAARWVVQDEGDMTPQTLRDVLYRHNILIANEDFVTLIAEMDADGDVTRNAV